MARFAQITGTGRYVPERVLTNADIEALVGEPVNDWLVENVGIHERHVMADDEVTSDLAVYAGERALVSAGLAPTDIDLVILATDTPDYVSPGTASVVQHKLGARRAGTFDLNNACAGWGTGMEIASKYLATDTDYTHILVIGAYGMTRFIDWTNKRTATLFADGAGAVILSAGDRPGFLGGKMIADGSYHDYMGVFVGGTACVTGGHEASPRQELTIQKRFPPETNSSNWPPLIRSLMQKIDRPLSAIDRIYFTQINLPTIQQVMAELEIPMSRTHTIMDKWGYTGSACMPMALDDAIEQGRGPQPGELVVFCSSGVGYTMTASAFIWV
jgi:3-oxoacyl-[acyl-carrier-protein] synthase-3